MRKKRLTVALEVLLNTATYRAFRFPWSALPTEIPLAVLKEGANQSAVSIYTSWNGATDRDKLSHSYLPIFSR
ncbi:MAG: hypothetical protein WAM60_15045 [Candidatus Promineifilaceae bacterium]